MTAKKKSTKKKARTSPKQPRLRGTTKEQVGQFMRRARESSERTIETLIFELGCSRGTLWRFEAGKFELSWVSVWQLLKLERVYGPELGLREAIAFAEAIHNGKRRPSKRTRALLKRREAERTRRASI